MPVPADVRIGLALSGGGFRAAAYHLGVLKRLEEMSLLSRIEALSCVSGGSVVGAFYALKCARHGTGAPGSYPVERLVEDMRAVLTTNVRGAALCGTPWRVLRTAVSFFSRRVSRVGLVVDELDKALYDGATLRDLPGWILINATNLATGRAWKFFPDRAGDFLAGATERTERIRVAEAVAASAAYPGLTDSFGFRTRWEELRSNLLDGDRWARPPEERPGTLSRWRERYGQSTGDIVFPLVDGGLYDNEGANGLRGRQVTHAILSGAAPAETAWWSGFGPGRLLRLVAVMHDRLGATTRQLTHEMTHAVHPERAAELSRGVVDGLRALAAERRRNDTDLARRLSELADDAERAAAVGTPSRGHQFAASAQILLHHTFLARNAYAPVREGGVDVPLCYRGLPAHLVVGLSHVRTDLDALEPRVLDLLIAQGYFSADAVVKAYMPDLVAHLRTEGGWYHGSAAPTWAPALSVAEATAANAAETELLLKAAARRTVLGRTPSRKAKWGQRVNIAVGPLFGLAVIAVTVWTIRLLTR